MDSTHQIYPDHPGFKSAGPSEDAATVMASCAPRMRKIVLETLRQAGPTGMTADELAVALNISTLSARPRLSELRRLGEIVPTGARRKNDSGMTATVWKVAPPPPWTPAPGVIGCDNSPSQDQFFELRESQNV